MIQGIFPPEQYGDYDQLFKLNMQAVDDTTEEPQGDQDAYNNEIE